MNIFKLSRRNVTETWWRSLSLGIFIFLATVLMLFFNSFIMTLKDNYYQSMRDSLTGDLQIRSGSTLEQDMLSLKGRFGEMAYLKGTDVADIESVLQNQFSDVLYSLRLRSDATLVDGTIRQHAAVIGLDPTTNQYQNAFLLTKGHYLDPNRADEVLLPTSYADKLKVSVGDTVTLEAVNKDNQKVTVTRTVAGIGDVERLSNFSFFPVYTSLKGALALTGFQSGDATDLVLFTKDQQQAEQIKQSLVSDLSAKGLGSDKVKVTLATDMGSFINSITSVYVSIMYSFIAVLLVIMGFLIMNLIFMMGMERRQEIGTLRAIGFSRAQIVWIFLGEILIITFLFFLLGLLVGVPLIYVLSQVGIPASGAIAVVLGNQFKLQFDAAQILPILGIVFGFTLLVSFYPSFKSASVRPSETLREAS